MSNLGRRVPPDFDHVDKYRMSKLIVQTIDSVEDVLPLPPFRAFYDQGQEGSCVGFGWSWAMSILNREIGTRRFPKYDARWLYHRAQLADEWDDTPPEEGTSVRAGGDVLRDLGDVQISRGQPLSLDHANGITANRWAVTVDEVRTGIALGIPVVVGVNWYSNFDRPETVGRDHWIGRGNLGGIRGGHCVCLYGASDRRQAVKITNNWGASYPLVWLPYTTLQRLLDENGEAALITDR